MAATIEAEHGVKPQLIKAAGGKFEVVINGELVFSKLKENRFPDDKEVLVEVARINAQA